MPHENHRGGLYTMCRVYKSTDMLREGLMTHNFNSTRCEMACEYIASAIYRELNASADSRFSDYRERIIMHERQNVGGAIELLNSVCCADNYVSARQVRTYLILDAYTVTKLRCLRLSRKRYYNDEKRELYCILLVTK